MRHLRDGELMVKFPIGAENMGPFPQPHFKFRSVRVVSAETTNYPVHLNALNAPWSLFVIAVAPYSTFVSTQVGKCFSKCFFFPSPSALLLFLSNLFRIFFLSQPRTGEKILFAFRHSTKLGIERIQISYSSLPVTITAKAAAQPVATTKIQRGRSIRMCYLFVAIPAHNPVS